MLPKDDELSANEEFKITVKHTFAIHRRKLICKEELYVSDDFHEDHYRKGHAMNNGERAHTKSTVLGFQVLIGCYYRCRACWDH